MQWLTRLFSADSSPLRPEHQQPVESRAAGSHHLALADAEDSPLELYEIVRDTTAAAVTLVVERTIALPDDDLVVLLASLRRCGLIADASGNLLPLVFFELARRTLVADGDDTRHKRLLAVLDLATITTCIHCRSVCADAVTQLANIARDPHVMKLSDFRSKARRAVDPEVFTRLAAHTRRLRAHEAARRKESASSPEESLRHRYDDPIAEIEAFCTAASLEVGRIRQNRSAEKLAVAKKRAQTPQ